MKKIVAFSLASIFLVSGVSAYTNAQKDAANYLAQKSIIVNHQDDVPAYRLDDTITRREMLKVMMNLSGKDVSDTCSGKFSDLSASDWGCKYAEAALENGYIAANQTFRPDDNVTNIEALKMVMQARNIVKVSVDDWRVGYVQAAQNEGVLDGDIDFNANAIRGWIFETAARSFLDFSVNPSNYQLSQEEEELFNSLGIPLD